MHTYQNSVEFLLDDIQTKEDLLYDMNDELEEIEAAIEREKQIAKENSLREQTDNAP